MGHVFMELSMQRRCLSALDRRSGRSLAFRAWRLSGIWHFSTSLQHGNTRFGGAFGGHGDIWVITEVVLPFILHFSSMFCAWIKWSVASHGLMYLIDSLTFHVIEVEKKNTTTIAASK